MIGFAAVIPLAVASLVTGPAELPSAWAGDIGAPIPTDQGTVFLYGDTMQPGNFVQGTTVVAGDTIITNALGRTVDDTFYWPGDGFQMSDGSLFVVMAEVRQVGDGSYGFTGVDHDAFVVSDPTTRAGWAWADKIEDGPWGNLPTAFSDQQALAFTLDGYKTSMWQIDTATSWQPIDATFPESQSPFVPVHTDDGWWGVSWANFAGGTVAALWHSEDAPGPYEWVRTLDTTGHTYDHSLNVIDGVVYHRFSTLNGRVTYQEEDL